MTPEMELPALEGTNPLGFLAALGVLDVLHRAGRDASLRWTDDLVPTPVVTGVDDHRELLSELDHDRSRWHGRVALAGLADLPLDDVKPPPAEHARWASAIAAVMSEGRAEADLYCGLVAEGAVDGSDHAKPTHLHFTAGQQRFLAMVRELARGAEQDRLEEALLGPWRYDSELPSLSWDGRGDRPYALRATDPSRTKRKGVPGADWLAFLGLAFYPVRVAELRSRRSLETTACDSRWKRSAFRWPLWEVALDRDTVRSLVADASLVGREADRRGLAGAVLARRGVLRVLEAPIRRTDQGGYGSFGACRTLAQARTASRR